MKPRYISILFFIVLLLHILSVYLQQDIVRTVSKVLLMPLLVLQTACVQTKGKKNLLFTALLLSWLGDLLLIGKEQSFFILGLVCFLCAHVVYIFQFIQIKSLRLLSPLKAIASLLLPVVLVAVVLQFTWNALGELRYPVLVYIAVISFMFVSATNTFSFPKHNILIAAGAKLFLLSDGLLALQMFYLKQDRWSMAVMLLYGVAQFCLTEGIMKALQTKRKETVVYANG